MEHWKPVVGFEKLYEVSDLGNFRSQPHEVTMACGGGKKTYRAIRGGNPVIPYPKGFYLYVSLRVKGNHIKCLGSHTIVCQAFHGDKPTRKHMCNHINGKKHDNRADNLEWVTAQENVLHAVHVLKTHPMGAKNANSKLTPERVVALRDAYASGLPYASMARALGVSRAAAGAAIHRKTWKHIA